MAKAIVCHVSSQPVPDEPRKRRKPCRVEGHVKVKQGLRFMCLTCLDEFIQWSLREERGNGWQAK